MANPAKFNGLGGNVYELFKTGWARREEGYFKTTDVWFLREFVKIANDICSRMLYNKE